MSVYSTIDLTETECIEKIAEHMGIDLEWKTKKTKQDLLSQILFELSSKNQYSPNYLNNYSVTPDK